jgi:hypothetical protein
MTDEKQTTSPSNDVKPVESKVELDETLFSDGQTTDPEVNKMTQEIKDLNKKIDNFENPKVFENKQEPQLAVLKELKEMLSKMTPEQRVQVINQARNGHLLNPEGKTFGSLSDNHRKMMTTKLKEHQQRLKLARTSRVTLKRMQEKADEEAKRAKEEAEKHAAEMKNNPNAHAHAHGPHNHAHSHGGPVLHEHVHTENCNHSVPTAPMTKSAKKRLKAKRSAAKKQATSNAETNVKQEPVFDQAPTQPPTPPTNPQA